MIRSKKIVIIARIALYFLRTTCVGMLLLGVSVFTHADTLKISQIAKSVLIGQAYPSGNLYLKMFTPVKSAAELYDLDPNSSITRHAPENVIVYCMFSKACNNPVVGKGGRIYNKSKNIHFDEKTYLPSKESMIGEEDMKCGAPFKKNMAFSYADDDFFRTSYDYCSFDDYAEIVQYHAVSVPATNLAYQAFAVSDHMKLENIIYFKEGTKRPLTHNERAKISRKKARYKKEEPDGCTTIPDYLDSAEKVLEANIAGTSFILRLSSYVNAGCGGHLGDYYVLDVLSKNKLKQSYFIMHYEGPV